ncbi:MAG: hypothetical protein WCL04_10435, partial [Verrucomicrobiota bacterium]
GSTTFLARALRCTEADLVAALAALGLVASETAGDKPTPTEIGAHAYWLNRDSRGGIWINGNARRETNGQTPEAGNQKPEHDNPPAPSADAFAAAPVADSSPAPEEAAKPADETEAKPAKKPASRLSRLASRLRPRSSRPAE